MAIRANFHLVPHQSPVDYCRADFGQLHVKVGTGVVSKRWGRPEFDLLGRVTVTVTVTVTVAVAVAVTLS
jgi:hypothetical protein